MSLASEKNESNRSFDAIVDEFINQLRRGIVPSIEEVAARNPHLSEEILCHFPGLIAAEKLAGHTCKLSSLSICLPMQIGNFKLVEEIGRGGMAVVYRAIHTKLAREFAVKVMSKEIADSRRRIERFQLEAQVIAKLHHPAIVPLFDFGSQDNLYFIAMRLIEGLTFNQILTQWQSPLPSELDALKGNWRILAGFFHEVCMGLNHVHEAGLVHRDIKPSNLMVDADSRVWIADFGLAKLRKSEHSDIELHDLAGTPRYLAPELAGTSANERSDIFSLGVTMYEMFSGVSAKEYNGQSLSRPNALPNLRDVDKRAPRAIAKIVSKATALNPAARYQTALEIADDLKSFAIGKRSWNLPKLANFRVK